MGFRDDLLEWCGERVTKIDRARQRLKTRPDYTHERDALLEGARQALDDVRGFVVQWELAHASQKAREAWAEVGKLFAQHFPGGVLFNPARGGVLPELRVGPFEYGQGEHKGQWAIVKLDGRRQVVDLKDWPMLLKISVAPREGCGTAS